MAVTIKSSQEIELMRQAGKILAKVHEGLKKELNPGMSTLDIDRIGEEMIRSFGCEPSFKNYQGYPASVCVSINEEVVHGIPRKDRIIEEGDIVSLDTGVIYKGYQSDAAMIYFLSLSFYHFINSIYILLNVLYVFNSFNSIFINIYKFRYRSCT